MVEFFIQVIRKTTIGFGGFWNASYEIRTFLIYCSTFVSSKLLRRDVWSGGVLFVFKIY